MRLLRRSLGALLIGLVFSTSAIAQAPRRPRVSVSITGPTVVAGDWKIEATVTTSTDSSSDTVNDKDRARVREYNTAEAKRQGELPQPDPVSQALSQPRPTRSLGPGFAVAERVNEQVDADAARARAPVVVKPVKQRGKRNRLSRRGDALLRANDKAPPNLALGGRPAVVPGAASCGHLPGHAQNGSTPASACQTLIVAPPRR
jgi:hypothetical protein